LWELQWARKASHAVWKYAALIGTTVGPTGPPTTEKDRDNHQSSGAAPQSGLASRWAPFSAYPDLLPRVLKFR